MQLPPRFISLCKAVGSNFLLTQGAGGNASIKIGDALFVKASGRQLRDSRQSNVFVQVDLGETRKLIKKGDLSAEIPFVAKAGLRPSIETLFHAILPQRYVFHLHSIELLRHLVECKSIEHYQGLFGHKSETSLIAYGRPGAELASLLLEDIDKYGAKTIYLLENHGVILAAENLVTIKNITQTIEKLTPKANAEILEGGVKESRTARGYSFQGYTLLSQPYLDKIVNDSRLFWTLTNRWAICPDHVTFLGDAPYYFDSQAVKSSIDVRLKEDAPDIFFWEGHGIYSSLNVNQNSIEQLVAYAYIISQIERTEEIRCLSQDEIAQLLGWDAEIYRQSLAR